MAGPGRAVIRVAVFAHERARIGRPRPQQPRDQPHAQARELAATRLPVALREVAVDVRQRREPRDAAADRIEIRRRLQIAAEVHDVVPHGHVLRDLVPSHEAVAQPCVARVVQCGAVVDLDRHRVHAHVVRDEHAVGRREAPVIGRHREARAGHLGAHALRHVAHEVDERRRRRIAMRMRKRTARVVGVPAPVHRADAEPDARRVGATLQALDDLRGHRRADLVRHHRELPAGIPRRVRRRMTVARHQRPEIGVAVAREPAVIPDVDTGRRRAIRRPVRFAVQQVVRTERLVLALGAQHLAIREARDLQHGRRVDLQLGLPRHFGRIGREPFHAEPAVEPPVRAEQRAAHGVAGDHEIAAAAADHEAVAAERRVARVAAAARRMLAADDDGRRAARRIVRHGERRAADARQVIGDLVRRLTRDGIRRAGAHDVARDAVLREPDVRRGRALRAGAAA